MSWMERLYETYELCQSQVGVLTPAQLKGERVVQSVPLLPICHTIQNAQIEVVVDEEGEFVPYSAFVVDKAESMTILPCTEESESRTINLEPHALFDKLQYVAGDYVRFGGQVKRHGYSLYMEGLKAWCASPYAHTAVRAVYRYLQKGCLIADLVGEGLLVCGEDGKLLAKCSEGLRKEARPAIFKQLSDQFSALVRFSVLTMEGVSRLYQEEAVRQSYIQYQAGLAGETDLCFVQGRYLPRSVTSPAKIRSTADKTKLISSNDANSNALTYRGKFLEPWQAANVGFETSQKAHSALRWLVNRQGWRNTDQVVLVWGTRNEFCPPVMEESRKVVEASPGDGPQQQEKFIKKTQDTPNTYAEYAQKVRRALQGYGKALDRNAHIAVLALDSTNGMVGRLSISYYRDMGGGEFLDRLNFWYATCAWELRYRQERGGRPEWVYYDGTPSPLSIVDAAYGSRASDKLKKETIGRLLPCLVDRASLPKDIVACAARRASAPLTMEEWEWRNTLGVACALLRKQINDDYNRKAGNTNYEEVCSMALDTQTKDRSYLFGRLLACADFAESVALDTAQANRQTNAVRFMHQFSFKPISTWSQLEQQLHYYLSRIPERDRIAYQNLLDDIMTLFDPKDYVDQRLADTYLLGYHCQRSVLRLEKEANDERERKESKKNKGKDE